MCVRSHLYLRLICPVDSYSVPPFPDSCRGPNVMDMLAEDADLLLERILRVHMRFALIE